MTSRVAVKTTTLGALFDRQLCMDYLVVMFESAFENKVEVEIDMESVPFVDFTVEAVGNCLADFPLTVTLQAYLDRSRNDLDTFLERDGSIRLVKGAYSGDINDFVEIQDRFLDLAEVLLFGRYPFKVGTHDPRLISWLREATDDKREKVEFQFLKGLGDETKLELAKEGWSVFEYVPYGPNGNAYESRRESYVEMLSNLGNSPVP